MIHNSIESVEKPSRLEAREWIRVLAKYRDPSLPRSIFELAVTIIPFVALWAIAWWALSVSYWLGFGIALLNGVFLLRLFTIQHDCGHGSFFNNRNVSDWVGRVLGVMTLTPYYVWRRTHSVHHSASGNLEKRGMGDVFTLTVAEYRAKSFWGRLNYRVYRNPVVLFGLGPTYLFFLQNRLPVGLMKSGWRYWGSAMGTNASIATFLAAIIYFGGIKVALLIFLPTTLIAASAGVWLFYVQHQFEETNWDHEPEWQVHDSALHGSSHYDLPPILQWFTASIGIHHVHHLYSRIPFYRLAQVLRDHPILAEVKRMTISESISCARLHLWDEAERKLVSFKQERMSKALA